MIEVVVLVRGQFSLISPRKPIANKILRRMDTNFIERVRLPKVSAAEAGSRLFY